jgi:hypothetical protein
LSEDSVARLGATRCASSTARTPDDRGVAYRDSAPKIDDFLSAEASDFFAR